RHGPEFGPLRRLGPPPAPSAEAARLPLPRVPALARPGRAGPGVRRALVLVGWPADPGLAPAPRLFWRPGAADRRRGARPGRGRSRPPAHRADPAADARALLRQDHEPGELLLRLPRRRLDARLDPGRDHQHALGRTPRLPAGRRPG